MTGVKRERVCMGNRVVVTGSRFTIPTVTAGEQLWVKVRRGREGREKGERGEAGREGGGGRREGVVGRGGWGKRRDEAEGMTGEVETGTGREERRGKGWFGILTKEKKPGDKPGIGDARTRMHVDSLPSFSPF